MLNEKYSWVNALRGYAILMLILIHSSQAFVVSNFIKTICNNGDLGVQLFFILSSFTLFNSYSKRKLVEKKSVNRNFFIRRFFRIAPYYYLAGFVYVLYRIFKNDEVSVTNLIANYSFTNGIYLPSINDIPPGGWSIGIEMIFYLIIPPLYRYINSLNKAILLLLITILVSILINHTFLSYTTYLMDIFFNHYQKWTFYFWMPNQLPVFILGIILFYINRNIVFGLKQGQIMLLSSIIFYFIFAFFEFSTEYPYYLIKREYLYGIIFVCFSIGVYTTNNKFIINRFIQKIGIVSFSMYLNHFLVITIINYFYNGVTKVWTDYLYLPKIILQNDFIFFCFYFFIVLTTFIFSNVTYKYIEVKGIDFGDKLISRIIKK